MKHNLLGLLIVGVSLLTTLVSPLRAQVVADGATAILDNVTNSITGEVTVGTNGPFTTLILTNGALLTNSLGGTIGLTIASKSNSVWLTSLNTRWFMANLNVGFSGAANQLVVSNGAVVRDTGGTLGLNPSSSNNVAVVTGAGSGWTNGDFIVGLGGPGNRLVVSDGGVLVAALGSLGRDESSSNNVAVVMGAGSVWTNSAGLLVGNFGASNQLVVTNGAVVANGNGIVGSNVSSSNNVVVVMGAGSLWTNVSALTVGQSGGGNQLMVSDGAVVWNGGGTLGNNLSSSNNVAVVTGAGSRWTNSSSLLVGNSGAGNQLVVSDGAVVANGGGTLGNNLSSSNNTAMVTGAGSAWRNGGSFDAGLFGSGNQLIVSNGGLIASVGGSVGLASRSNLAVVTGPGSVWTNFVDLFVGQAGSGNRLVVTNGGRVQNNKGSLGTLVDGAGNLAVVTGAGSQWNNVNELRVGSTGSGNQLVVSNGGTVRNMTGMIGFDGNNNVAAVTGVGSGWTNVGELIVGWLGFGNQLVVTNGGVVQSSSLAYIGRDVASSNNLALVTGVGSLWTNAGDLNVGYNGSGNQLVVSNGAWVRSLIGRLGFLSGSNNVAVVTGAGSVWSNATFVRVGGSGSGSRLTVSDGGTVVGLAGFVGDTGSNNLAVVTGAGSLWTNTSGLQVGVSSSGNQLVVTNGGTVYALLSIVLGANSSSSTNNRVITDGGTLCVTNVAAVGVFDLRRGTNVLNAGTNDVDRLVMTNIAGRFEFNGGTLNVRTSTVNNGVTFTVGNGSGAASYRMSGTPTERHNFANGLLIASNGLITGNGTIVGGVTVQSGGTLSPGTSVGTVVLSNSPSLQGATLIEISKNGVTLTNDQVQVAGPLTYGGSLTVSDLGPTALVVGDRFQLFIAPAYGGAFTSLTLPPLGAGLGWTNKLLLDGSIEVAAVTQPPNFSNVTLVGTNIVISGTGGTPGANYTILTATNVAEPLSNWVSLETNQFDVSGNFSFTNGVTPGDLQRYFRFRTP